MCALLNGRWRGRLVDGALWGVRQQTMRARRQPPSGMRGLKRGIDAWSSVSTAQREGPDEDGDWQCPVTSRRPDLDTIHHGLYELVGGAGVNDYRLGETMDDPWAPRASTQFGRSTWMRFAPKSGQGLCGLCGRVS